MTMRIDFKKLLISIVVPLAVAGISSLISVNGMKMYENFEKPQLSPPAWIFPVVWSVLFLLMGISLYLVWNSKNNINKSYAYLSFAVQLFLNFIWSPVFFGLQSYLFALIILMLLIIFVAAMIITFYQIEKTAGLLQIPYFIWLLFAAYLNYGVYYLSK